MGKLITIVVFLIFTIGMQNVAYSQIPGFGRSASQSSEPSTNLLESFSISNGHNLDAQSQFATALGLLDQVQLLQAEQSAISSGQIDQDSTEKAISVSASAQEAIAARLADQPELTAEGKESYTQGLVSYFLAIAAARDLVAAVQETTTSARSNPLAAARNAGSTAFVARQAPIYLKNLQDNASMLIAFGRSNGIEPPRDATSLLDSL